MVDLLGNEIEVGDIVALADTDRTIHLAVVIDYNRIKCFVGAHDYEILEVDRDIDRDIILVQSFYLNSKIALHRKILDYLESKQGFCP